MRKLLFPISLLLFFTFIFVACQREAIPPEEGDIPVITDRKLKGAELDAYMDRVARLSPDKTMDVMPLDPNDVGADALYCVYTVTGVQGGGCGNLPPHGGSICVLCEEGWPGGACPDKSGDVWRHYDSNGNLICTGTITGGAGPACDECPEGGFKVVHRPNAGDVEVGD